MSSLGMKFFQTFGNVAHATLEALATNQSRNVQIQTQASRRRKKDESCKPCEAHGQVMLAKQAVKTWKKAG